MSATTISLSNSNADLLAMVADLLAMVAGTAGVLALTHLYLAKNKKKKSRSSTYSSSDEHIYQNPITTLDELRQTIPVGASGSTVDNAPKVVTELDDQMIAFIQQSPLIMLATSDTNGLPFVSPKGDHPGFVKVSSSTRLLIPDRPGNRLVFGWQNVLENPHVGLLFQIPGNDTTLRVGGTAKLFRDPTVCKELSARGTDAKLFLALEVKYAFFHCSKAYIRSQLWKPEKWPEEPFKVTWGKYFSSVPLIQKKVEEIVAKDYEDTRQSVEGIRSEPS